MSYDNLDELMKQAIEKIEAEEASTLEAVQKAEGAGEASKEVCAKVLSVIGKESGTSNPSEVAFATAYLLQRGATSPKTPGQTKFIYGTTTVTVEVIRKACRQEKVTVRQFARGLKDPIANMMLALGEQAPEGNLAKTMRLENPRISKEEAVWASDFQTYNPKCPTKVKNWLVKNYRERFRKQ